MTVDQRHDVAARFDAIDGLLALIQQCPSVLVGWMPCQSTRLRTVIGRASAGLVRRLSIGPSTEGETPERRLVSLHGGKRDPLAHGTRTGIRGSFRWWWVCLVNEGSGDVAEFAAAVLGNLGD